MTRFLFFISLLVLSVNSIYAQQNGGTITGTITTSDGKPASNVTIRIEKSKWGGISDENGTFSISDVRPGNWQVKVTAVAVESQEKTVTVTAGQTVQLNFVLKENSAQLHEIIISSYNRNKENRVVAKMPLKNLDNPQVYTTVSSDIMKQQGIVNYDDALRNVPGLSRTWESTGRGGDGAAYFALRGFEAQPSLINGLPGLTAGNLDPANVEEIQVIKGPSGTLFGGSFYAYGGMINTITKKPYFDFGGEVGYSFGSFGLHRVTADVNVPLSKKVAMRINTAYHSEKSFQDAGMKKSFFLAPSLTYNATDRLSFQVMAEVLDEKRAVAPVFFHSDRATPLRYKTIQELNLNNDLSFTSNELTIKNPRYNIQAQMLYKLSDQWSSQTVVSNGRVKSDGIYSYIWDDAPGDEWYDQYFHDENQRTSTLDIQQNFNGDFKIGKLRNRLLIGVDYFRRNVVDKGSGWAATRSVTAQGDVRYYADPWSGDTIGPLPLTKAAIYGVLSGTDHSNSNISNSSYSAYFSDVVNITPGLMAMVSLRADYFDSKGEKETKDDDFNQFALSPKFGLIYQPILNKVSLFANYMNAFINVAPQQVSDENGENPYVKSFKPEHANQLEYGVKANLLEDKLHATFSVYDITVSNRVMPDATNPNDVTQGGKVGSRGFELEINATPVKGLDLIAGFSHNHTKVKEGAKDDFYSQPGRAPGGQGPGDLANVWANYRFTQGPLKNFGLGIGGNYASRYKVIDNSATGDFYLPNYALLNAAVSFNSRHFRVSLNVNNITDKEYYIGYWSVNPQRPRNYTANFAYKF
ncbi:iron complex outermembrane recepter protein [Chitinophaga sp. YR627]|uniref:TonB-dependent receptor n=1 Tax=Chitinophaga sp. YR627 TaxID=1881041 RepID=UPI0008EF5C17|nr:TonB-dependent receptor [Chitinophaga sp. YR627]SFM82222.1 iron complex outermembrane recepter protein [Chitinophaga sp. YR627]